MRESREPTSCLVVGNYCHDVLMKDGIVLAESLGGAASFISAVLDGVSIPSTLITKVGSDFSYSVTHPPLVSPSSRTTLFHAHFSSQIQRHDRVLKRALIRVFDPADGTVSLVHLRDSGFDHLLRRIGFLKASSEEALYIDVEEAKKECCVVVTNGKDGCTVYHGNVEQQIAPFPAVQVDPTGAGDSFLGGLVVGVAHGLAVPDAALLGNFFGSLTVGQVGLPKFDLRLLQAVKDELQRKRLNKFGCHESQNNKLVFVKPPDHEEFRTALVAAKASPAVPIQQCHRELPSSPRVAEHHNHLICSGEQNLLLGNACEEPIKSGDGIPDQAL
ncbi:Inositol 3-kinase [Sesamum alatum]|uniref:Inositol 3-kinase n=1 Tax=Sesamum alatum TaxID=300844 RepID=A0AAE1XJ82_9LAMI|nr:Inositol 3-kinase [Sesamum alatum]